MVLNRLLLPTGAQLMRIKTTRAAVPHGPPSVGSPYTTGARFTAVTGPGLNALVPPPGARVVTAAIIPARGSLWPCSLGHGPLLPAWALTLDGWGRRPKARPIRSISSASDDSDLPCSGGVSPPPGRHPPDHLPTAPGWVLDRR
eukprot:7967143-Pyramimonas_sp.AAC.1